MANGIGSMALHPPYAISPQPLAMDRLLGTLLRPDRSLVFALGHRLHPLVEEALQAAAVVGLGRVDVPLRVGGDAVDGVELAGHLAAVAEAGEDLERLPIENPDLLVLAVREVDELLLRIVRERDVPGRAVAERPLGHPRFLHELAVG